MSKADTDEHSSPEPVSVEAEEELLAFYEKHGFEAAAEVVRQKLDKMSENEYDWGIYSVGCRTRGDQGCRRTGTRVQERQSEF